jgi:hypothetical protein
LRRRLPLTFPVAWRLREGALPRSAAGDIEIAWGGGTCPRLNSIFRFPHASHGATVSLLARTFPIQRRKDWFGDEVFFGLMRIRGMECWSRSGFAEAFFGRKLIVQP